MILEAVFLSLLGLLILWIWSQSRQWSLGLAAVIAGYVVLRILFRIALHSQ